MGRDMFKVWQIHCVITAESFGHRSVSAMSLVRDDNSMNKTIQITPLIGRMAPDMASDWSQLTYFRPRMETRPLRPAGRLSLRHPTCLQTKVGVKNLTGFNKISPRIIFVGFLLTFI